MINDEANKVIKQLFDALKRQQNNLESMNGSGFVFAYVYLLYYKCPKVSPNRGGSYIYIYILLIAQKTKQQQ